MIVHASFAEYVAEGVKFQTQDNRKIRTATKYDLTMKIASDLLGNLAGMWPRKSSVILRGRPRHMNRSSDK